MRNAQHNYLGFHGHAILLSLPPVLLVWAIIAFTISMISYGVQGITDIDVLERVSAWVSLVVFAVILAAVVLALHTFSIIWSFRHRQVWSWRWLTSMWSWRPRRVVGMV